MAVSTPKSVLITGYGFCTANFFFFFFFWTDCDLSFRCSPGSIGDSLAREFLKRSMTAISHSGNRRSRPSDSTAEYTVCATALPFEKLSELESLGVHTYPLDVTSEKSVTALKDEVSRDLGGRLDVLINCA